MTEQQIQNKIITYLEDRDYYCVKLIKTNKNGIPDVVAYEPETKQPIFIEVKKPNGKLSTLQQFRISEMLRNGLKVIVAYGFDDFHKKFYNYM